MKKLLIFLLLSVSALATTTVTGTIRTLGTTTVGSGTFVRFWLRGCGGNQPRVSGSGVIAPSQGGVYFFDLAANGSGVVSGTIYSTRDNAGTGNGDIECGGSNTAVWYGMQIFLAGKGGPEVAVVAKNGATLDISNVTPITTNPVVTAPIGDNTYLRLDAGNSPVTGPITFGSNVTATAGQNTLDAYLLNGVVHLDGIHFATLAAAVAACPSPGSVVVDTPGTWTVAANLAIPSTCGLTVNDGAIISIASGKTLTFASQPIAGLYQIFTGSGTVLGLTTAYPEWWGTVGTCTTGACPQASIAAAALTSGGVVQFQRARYRSGFESSGTKVTNTGIWLKGAGMPQYNGTYTQMVAGSGTIIEGKVAAEADSFEMTDLGIDVGSVVDAALLSGVPTDAFGINNDGQILATPPSKNPIFINIATLGQNAAAAVHGFLMENVTGGYAENIHTAFNTHGFVLKGDHTTVNGLYSIGHNTDCLIIKSDDYAPTNNDSLTNIHCDVVNAGDTASGIVINPQAAVMSNVSISAVTIGGTGGISDAINLQLNNTSDHISISGVSIKGGTKQSVCLHVQGTTPGTAYTISGLTCDNYNYLVFQSQLLNSSTLSGFTGTNIGTGGNVGMLLEGIGEEVTNLVNSGTFVTGFSVDCATCTVYLNSWALPGFAGTNWATSGGGQIFPGFGSPYMISPNGFFSGGVTTTASVTLGTVTPVATGTVASAQAMVVRDNTNGGAAIIVNDANGGPVIIGSIGTTVFVTGAPGATQVQVTNVAGQIKLLGGASRNNAVIAFTQLGN